MKHQISACGIPYWSKAGFRSSWRTDDCTSCECTIEAKVICYRQQCDEDTSCNGKPLTIKGRCCPVCEDALSAAVCSFDASVYSVGEEWRQDTCTNCSCQPGGRTVCRQLVCPQCVEPVPIEGHCCPLCKGERDMKYCTARTGPHFVQDLISDHSY
ncbi:von Willebrand factor type C domain protein [Oesophagostomum dentatum]|uniref:von Willebrand factor type C domain protein n=1 Tax=Oesophagostomum dentatum TaxID=61180 RepID=A0A0B1SXY5_OESDE|nr:von Willebrand factor type C domain protein [Oesophagostomum dentatum]